MKGWLREAGGGLGRCTLHCVEMIMVKKTSCMDTNTNSPYINIHTHTHTHASAAYHAFQLGRQLLVQGRQCT